MKRLSIILVVGYILSGCSGNDEDFRELPDISDIQLTVSAERLEEEMQQLQSPEALAVWMNERPVVRDLMWGRGNYVNPVTGQPDSSLFMGSIWEAIQHPTFTDTLLVETRQAFGDLADLEDQLTLAFRRLKAYDPNFTVPKVQTLVTGFTRDLYVSDTLWIVSLDCFIGPKASYRPTGPGYQGLPYYLLRRYQKEYILPMLLKSYALKYITPDQTPNAGSLLSEMIGFGKTYEFTKSVLPELADSLILRYSEEELLATVENEGYIWRHFIENEALFNKNQLENRAYLEEAPNVPAIGQKCPGRIGRYMGWQVLEAFRRERPDMALMDLLQLSSAQAILETSRYKPK